MTKIPKHAHFVFLPDQSGIMLGSFVGRFQYTTDDPYVLGSDETTLNVDDKIKEAITALYNKLFAAFCEKHKTMGQKEAYLLYEKGQQPQPSVAEKILDAVKPEEVAPVAASEVAPEK